MDVINRLKIVTNDCRDHLIAFLQIWTQNTNLVLFLGERAYFTCQLLMYGRTDKQTAGRMCGNTITCSSLRQPTPQKAFLINFPYLFIDALTPEMYFRQSTVTGHRRGKHFSLFTRESAYSCVRNQIFVYIQCEG